MREDLKTLPDTLEATFLEFRQHLPNAPTDNLTIFDVWTKTLSGNAFNALARTDGHDLAVMSRITSVFNMLENTISQISNSNSLNENRKKSAVLIVEGFLPTVRCRSLMTNAIAIRDHCSEVNCGQLGIVSALLEGDFSEGRLSGVEVQDLLSILNEIDTILDDEQFPILLRKTLWSKVRHLIWRLSKPQLESTSDIVEALADATVTASRLERLCPEDGTREKAMSVKQKLSESFHSALATTEKGAKLIIAGKIAYDAGKALWS